MTYENFLKVILRLQRENQTLQKLHDCHLDLANFVEPYNIIISTLIEEIYGTEGLDWWNWFCYDNHFGQGKLQAWDKDKNPICYDPESLWKYLEKLKTEKES